jgi:hypothetical protein
MDPENDALNPGAIPEDDSKPAAPTPPPPPPSDGAGSEAAGGLPRLGFTTAAHPGLAVSRGDGTQFRVRTGPNYKKTGAKVLSAPHIYDVLSVDVFKREHIEYHMA